MSKQFKAGDLVYRPILSTKIYKLGATNSDSLTIMSDGGKGCFYPDGNYFTWHANPSIFHATSENHALLEQLYGVEFEKPKPTALEIIRALFRRGDKYVFCWVSNDTMEPTRKDNWVCIEKIVEHSAYPFFDVYKRYGWKYATPVDLYTGEAITGLPK